MKISRFISVVFIATLTLTSCSDDEPTPMAWEFSNYNSSHISAIYDPDQYTQVQIKANHTYTGEITLTCTNFSSVNFHTWESDSTIRNKECGYIISKSGANTLKISFSPIRMAEGSSEVSDFVGINGINGKEMSTTNMQIVRF